MYFDHAATSAVRPEVIALIAEVMDGTGNASSVHSRGRSARALVERAREQVAGLVGARPQEVIFTSGGTEANNHVLHAHAMANDPVLVSAIEHDSVLHGVQGVETFAVTPAGVPDLAALEGRLNTGKPGLISLMLVNNETGVVQPVDEVARLARAAGWTFHTDAVQAVGKLPLAMGALGVDYLSLSGHKFGGPQGVGALVLRPGMDPAPFLRGGGQERRRRAGTENVAGITGLGLAAELALTTPINHTALQAQLETALREAVPGLAIVAEGSRRVSTITCALWPKASAERLVMKFDLKGVAVSSGSACSSGKVTASHVLSAMGHAPTQAQSALRFSTGWNTTDADIVSLADVMRSFS